MAAAVRNLPDAELIERRKNARRAALDREDIFLLMESYDNTVTLNTKVLERQDVLNANIERLIKELMRVCENQAKILEEIQQIEPGTKKSFATILAELSAMRLAEVKAHSGHNNRIYVALVGMVAIVASLIGLLFKVGP
jgi:hypothetical protein